MLFTTGVLLIFLDYLCDVKELHVSMLLVCHDYSIEFVSKMCVFAILLVDILFITSWLKCAICLRMYMKKVSNDQQPSLQIMSQLMSLSLAAMAPPAQREWLPTNFF